MKGVTAARSMGGADAGWPAIMGPVGLFGARRGARLGRRKRKPDLDKEVADAAVDHLTDFIDTRYGVEAWVEEATASSEPTLLLVAVDGEWTRRRVKTSEWAFKFARKHKIPAYQAGIVSYPQRMRDYNARKKLEEKRRAAEG